METLSLEEHRERFYTRLKNIIPHNIIELGKDLDAIIDTKRETLFLKNIEKLEELISESNNIPTNMQIEYYIANLYHSLRINSTGENHTTYHEKEIFSLRKIIDIYEIYYFSGAYENDNEIDDETFVANYIAMRVYTNFGNSICAVGRYIEGINSYKNALLIRDDFSMASMNLSGALFEYGFFNAKEYERQYYYHSAYYYYREMLQSKVNLEDSSYIEAFESKYLSHFTRDFIENYLQKPLSLPGFDIELQEEVKSLLSG